MHLLAYPFKELCKVAYRVEVDEDLSYLNCECGNFEQSGMIYCDAVKVLIYSVLNNLSISAIVLSV
jgi:hypothetical protein